MNVLADLVARLGPSLLLIFLCAAAWASQVFALPGNWIALGFASVFGLVEGFRAVAWWVLVVGALLAALGEGAEFLGTWQGVRRGGGNRWSGIAALVGSIVGAVVGGGFGYGLGAIPGTVVGAFAGALVVETLQRRKASEALRRGFWAGAGRAFGLGAKLGLGGAFLVLLALRLAWAAFPRA